MSAAAADSDEKSGSSPTETPLKSSSTTLEELPWIENAVQQAQIIQKTLEQTLECSIRVAGARLSEIRATSYAHFNQTLDDLQEIKSEYAVYEDAVFWKIKEGIAAAASHPVITCGAAAGLGLVVLKRPRRFLVSNMSRLFLSEETMLSRADAKVKVLRQTIDLLKTEAEKLEKSALQAEEEMRRGRTKLRQAGKQIQGVIRSAYKIERQARGLKDVVSELPSREASLFRTQVSNLASEAKRERNTLTKEVSKISNYGISV